MIALALIKQVLDLDRGNAFTLEVPAPGIVRGATARYEPKKEVIARPSHLPPRLRTLVTIVIESHPEGAPTTVQVVAMPAGAITRFDGSPRFVALVQDQDGKPIALYQVEPQPADDPSRCAVCAWPLAESVEKGCVRGNCSLRPLPERPYNLARAIAEHAPSVRHELEARWGGTP